MSKKNKRATSIMITVTILAAVIIILLIFLMQGSTTTTGNYPDNVSNKSLTCTTENIDYPFFTYDNAIKKTTEINILFSKDKLKSIALIYSLYYNDSRNIIGSEAHNHAAMNESFGANSLNADAYNAQYAKLEDRMQMNLYATSNQVNSLALKYFLIDASDDYIPSTIANYKTIYESNGMKCTESE